MESKSIINHKLDALRNSQFKTVIFAISGSVASIKAKEISEQLLLNNLNVYFYFGVGHNSKVQKSTMTRQQIVKNRTIVKIK